MPIYAYRCSACGHAQDVLQKMSDPVLNVCPACGQPTYCKQVTAAGFQLKGSGWYATDFRGGQTANPDKADKAETGDKTGEAKPAADKTPADAAAAPKAEASASKPGAPAAGGTDK